MPVKSSAVKALKVAKRRALENQRTRVQMKRAIKVASLADQKEKAKLIQKAQSVVDKAVKQNIIHRNKAARVIARLAK